MISRGGIQVLAIAGLLASMTGPAYAQEQQQFPEKKPYIGAFVGGNIPVRDWDLGKYASETVNPETSFIGGLRLGYQILPQLAIEIGGGFLPLTYDSATSGNAVILSLEALYHFMPGKFSPFVEVGGGLYDFFSGDLDKDADPQGHAGIGVRGLVASWVALRAEGRYVVSDGFSDAGSGNLEITAGIDIFPPPGKKLIEVVKDADGDGIADADDKCPDVAGPAATGGCPDADDDGIADNEDKCPDAAGSAALGGCPDADGDGITDAEDKCPQVAGKPELQGCPDADGDGITDAEDKCPNEAGVANLQGCPDRDRDGIADADDKCPDQAGVPAEQGCLPKAAEKFQGAIKGIQFQTGSAKILKKSYKTLDQAVAVLKEFPTLRLRIEGHTDNVGNPEDNQKLSQARAESVRDYMVSKGLEATRFETVGFGDTKPVADNAKAKGRAQNRRIEFGIIGQ